LFFLKIILLFFLKKNILLFFLKKQNESLNKSGDMEFVTNDKLMFVTLIHAGEWRCDRANQICSLQNVCGQLNAGFDQFAAVFVVIHGGRRPIRSVRDIILLAPVVFVKVRFNEPPNVVHLVEAHLNNAGLNVFSRVTIIVPTYNGDAIHRIYLLIAVKGAMNLVPSLCINNGGRPVIEYPPLNLCVGWKDKCRANIILGLKNEFASIWNNVASQSRRDLIKWAHHTQAIYYRRVRIGADMPRTDKIQFTVMGRIVLRSFTNNTIPFAFSVAHAVRIVDVDVIGHVEIFTLKKIQFLIFRFDVKCRADDKFFDAAPVNATTKFNKVIKQIFCLQNVRSQLNFSFNGQTTIIGVVHGH
jgi:hypothetical protein